VESIGYFLVASKGTYIEQILPSLLLYLEFLLQIFRNVDLSYSPTLYSDAVDFASTLIIQLGEIAMSIGSWKIHVVSKVLEFYKVLYRWVDVC